jgi:hypothetical protein
MRPAKTSPEPAVANQGDGCRVEREAGSVRAVLYVTLPVPIIVDRKAPVRKRA